MTAFERMQADLMDNPDIGIVGWWLPRVGASTSLQLVARVPAAGELQRRAPASRPQMLVDLPATAAAGAGDVVAWSGRSWLLGGQGDPDPLGLTSRWIATELEGEVSYDAEGRPQLAWTDLGWVPAA